MGHTGSGFSMLNTAQAELKAANIGCGYWPARCGPGPCSPYVIKELQGFYYDRLMICIWAVLTTSVVGQFRTIHNEKNH